jgi:sulfite dehydrogenase (cytochrome) subunit B
MKFKLLLVYSALTGISSAAELKITLPEETAAFKPGKGVELAQGQCLMCHSADYVSMQPPMPRKFWEATLKKMKEKFGAPTPDDQLSALADYFTAAYGVPEK